MNLLRTLTLWALLAGSVSVGNASEAAIDQNAIWMELLLFAHNKQTSPKKSISSRFSPRKRTLETPTPPARKTAKNIWKNLTEEAQNKIKLLADGAGIAALPQALGISEKSSKGAASRFIKSNFSFQERTERASTKELDALLRASNQSSIAPSPSDHLGQPEAASSGPQITSTEQESRRPGADSPEAMRKEELSGAVRNLNHDFGVAPLQAPQLMQPADVQPADVQPAGMQPEPTAWIDAHQPMLPPIPPLESSTNVSALQAALSEPATPASSQLYLQTKTLKDYITNPYLVGGGVAATTGIAWLIGLLACKGGVARVRQFFSNIDANFSASSQQSKNKPWQIWHEHKKRRSRASITGGQFLAALGLTAVGLLTTGYGWHQAHVKGTA